MVQFGGTVLRWLVRAGGDETMNRDHDHLRMLVIFHYVHAALVTCSTSFGVIYLGFFATMMPMIASEIEAEAARERATAKQSAEAAEELKESRESESEKDAETEETDEPSSDGSQTPPTAQPAQAPFGDRSPDAMFSMVSAMMYSMGAIMLVFGFAMAFANVYAARCIARRKHRTFCLLTAGFNCLNTPLGLILGVCSFLVLLRPSIEDLFDGDQNEGTDIIDAAVVD